MGKLTFILTAATAMLIAGIWLGKPKPCRRWSIWPRATALSKKPLAAAGVVIVVQVGPGYAGPVGAGALPARTF